MSIQDSINQITTATTNIASEAQRLQSSIDSLSAANSTLTTANATLTASLSKAGDASKYVPTVNPALSLKSISNCRKHVHVVGWFGNSSHIDVGYNSQSYDTIAWQLDQIIAKGIDGVNMLFSGVAKDFTKTTAQRVLKAADDRGLITSVMIDHEADVTADDFKWALDNLATGKKYWKWAGKRVLFVFDSPTSAQLAAIPSDVAIIYRNSGGLGKVRSSGCFGWPLPGSEASYCTSFYKNTAQAIANNQLAIPHVSPGFGGAPWNHQLVNGVDTFKPTPMRYGQEWLDSIQRVIDSKTNPTDVLIATWNDHEEATGIERTPLL